MCHYFTASAVRTGLPIQAATFANHQPSSVMNTASLSTAKDLSEDTPRSARERLGGYAILARCLDKGRAEINNTAGDFHFNCPLDNQLFSFKGVKGEDVRKLLENGASDEDVVEWLNNNGTPRTREEIEEWSIRMDNSRPDESDREKQEWFAGECGKLGLDPAKTTLFEYLDEDDRITRLLAA
jgi:hypothetical protein